MSRSSKFAKRLKDELNGTAGYKWDIGRPPCDNRECVDVQGEDGNSLALIEVELRRSSPVGNVVKIGKWLDRKSNGVYAGKKIVLVQAFSAYYKSHKFHREKR